jgi:hypothetical protein
MIHMKIAILYVKTCSGCIYVNIRTFRGIRQGSVSVPVLLNIVLNEIIRKVT